MSSGPVNDFNELFNQGNQPATSPAASDFVGASFSTAQAPSMIGALGALCGSRLSVRIDHETIYGDLFAVLRQHGDRYWLCLDISSIQPNWGNVLFVNLECASQISCKDPGSAMHEFIKAAQSSDPNSKQSLALICDFQVLWPIFKGMPIQVRPRNTTPNSARIGIVQDVIDSWIVLTGDERCHDFSGTTLVNSAQIATIAANHELSALKSRLQQPSRSPLL